MHPATTSVGSGLLFERATELEQINSILRSARQGEGRALMVEGPPGIGKTALLQAAWQEAEDSGMIVLTARGDELEAHFPHGVVRQLFEPALRRMPPGARRDLLSGAARLAAPIVAGDAEVVEHDDQSATALARTHGLYWLVVNLSQRAPVLISVDDAQWADQSSLRFLFFLARRLSGTAAAVLVALRSNGRGTELLAELTRKPLVRLVKPSPLSEHAVARVLTTTLGQAPDLPFAAACRAATGGVPFLVRELASALLAENVRPAAEEARRVQKLGPRTVVLATLSRVARKSDTCVALARAVSVLGSEAQLPRAARLAELDSVQALEALDVLVAGDVVRAGQRIEFVHPILRTAVHEDLLPGQRSVLHRKAAALLAAEGAEIDAIAAQLLASDPAGSEEVALQLRDAASHALAHGAPEDAVAYLARALQEGGDRELRANLSYELARAEKLVADPAALEHFAQARRLADDPVFRGRAALELSGLLVLSGQWDTPAQLIEEALTELGDRDPQLSQRMERLRAGHAAYDPRHVADYNARLPLLREMAAQDSLGGRSIALLNALIAANRGASGPGDAAFLNRGWDVRQLLAAGMDEWALDQGIGALVLSEELDQAREVTESVLASGRERGSLLSFITGSGFRAWVEARLGRLGAAESEIRAALEPAREQNMTFALPFLLWAATDILLERPEATDLAALTEQVDMGSMAETCNGAYLYEVRGRVRQLTGRTEEAVEDLRRAGTIYRALGFRNPNATSWRSGLALVLRTEDPAEARRLVLEELEDARQVGHARSVGVALRALGLLDGLDGLPHLEEAVRVLEKSVARLEHGRALVELGSALRRAGQRTSAREPLRAGLDIAVTSEATRLAERASEELAAAGARPRRLRVTGLEALTPSEMRVARLVAEGLTNNEVAQALFITPKTVDTHLSHVYTKLGISSRHLLASALANDPAA
jgi:DNA-binding CsgD family transcriptional regulator